MNNNKRDFLDIIQSGANRSRRNSGHVLWMVSAFLVTLTSACTGQYATYPTKSVKPEEPIEVIPVTPEFFANNPPQFAHLTSTDAVTSGGLSAGDDYQYLIGPSDILTLSVPSIVSSSPSPTSTTGAVSPAGTNTSPAGEGYVVFRDGTIYLPYVGHVKVGGKTLAEAQEVILASLTKFVRSPQIVVAVKEYRSQRVTIAGAVTRPGPLPITDVPLTVVDALSVAGGISEIRGRHDPRLVSSTASTVQQESPDLNRILVRHAGKDYTVDVGHMLASGDLSGNMILYDRDVVIVPATVRANIVVMGEVLHPTLMEVIPFETTLSDVVMATGGINQLTANASRCYIVRGDFNKPTVFQVDLGSPEGMLLAQQFEIAPRDIVYVAEAQISRFNRTLTQILSPAQGLLGTAVVAHTVQQGN